MGSARDQAKSYIDQLEEDLATLRQQLSEAVSAQGVAEVRAATLELQVSIARSEALQELSAREEPLKAAVVAAQVEAATTRGMYEASENQLAKERIAREETERERVAEATKAATLRAELEQSKRSPPASQPTPQIRPTMAKPITMRSVVRERDGNGKALVVDHQFALDS